MTNREAFLNMTIGELLPKTIYAHDPFYIRRDILSDFLCDVFECKECPICDSCELFSNLGEWLDYQIEK